MSAKTTETTAPEPVASPAPTPIAARFTTAADSPAPTQDQHAIVRAHASVIITAAEQIDQLPNSHQKALALTHLEEALMWANKAVFA